MPGQGQPNQFGRPNPGGAPIQQGGAGPQGQPGQPGGPNQLGNRGPATGTQGARVTGPQGAGAPGPQGAASIDQLRAQRERTTDKSGNTVIKEGDRQIVRTGGGKVVIQTDESERVRRFAPNVKVEVRGNERFAVYERPGNVQIINITDNNGHLLRRVRRGSDGREVVLIENSRRGPGFGTGLAVGLAVGVGAVVALNLAPPVINIPRERYIVDLDVAPPDMLYDTLAAPPLMAIERAYTLDEIRYNVELRDRMRRIDINTITFDTGSWTVTPDQYDRLAGVADAILRLLRRRPDEMVMIEGHTDAVGNDEDNLSLSDRRAETVASILIEQFGIPAENLVTQGYGEQYLKIQTQEANRINRRVAVRPIGSLLAGNYRN